MDRVLYVRVGGGFEMREMRTNNRIPCSMSAFSVQQQNPRTIQGSRTYIVSEPSLVKLVRKRMSANAAMGRGSKANQNPSRAETNCVGRSG